MLKAFAALLVFSVLPPVLASPKCSLAEAQVKPVVILCTGSGGTTETNLAKVELAKGEEYVLALLPKGMTSFKASAKSLGNVDLMLRDPATKARIDLETNGEKEYQKMRITTLHTAGTPTTETLTCAGAMPQNLELVVKNNDAVLPNGVSVEVGYFYDPWSGATACTWKTNTGCEYFDQAKYQALALTYSTALHAGGRTCSQAWSSDAVPQTPYGSHVPYYKWPAVFHKVEAGKGEAAGMYKFATNGGMESGKEYVDQGSFDFVCKMNVYKPKFIDPCCAKLRTAFTDETDAFTKMKQMATTIGRPGADDVLWEICKSIPTVPFEFTIYKDNFLSYWHSGGSLVASDLKSCYPNGKVVVQPTPAPLFTLGGATKPSNDVPVNSAGKKPWEMDGTENLASGASCTTYTFGCPAGKKLKTDLANFKCWAAACTAKDAASCCQVGTKLSLAIKAGATVIEVADQTGFNIGDVIQIGAETNEIKGISSIILNHPVSGDHPANTPINLLPKQDVTRTLQPTTSDANPTGPTAHGAPAAMGVTTTVVGITMKPGVLHGSYHGVPQGATTSSGPNYKGYGIAVAAGTAVAGAAAAGAVAIHHIITKHEEEEAAITGGTLTPGGTPVPGYAAIRAREGTPGYTIRAREDAIEEESSGSMSPLLFVIAICACAGILGICVGAFMFYSSRKKRAMALDRQFGYDDDYDDEEPFMFNYGYGAPRQSMGMMPGPLPSTMVATPSFPPAYAAMPTTVAPSFTSMPTAGGYPIQSVGTSPRYPDTLYPPY
jgi:hypothetical protein